MNRKVKSVFLKTCGIILCVASFFLFTTGELGVVAGTLMLIGGIVLYSFSSSEMYNKLVDQVKQIDNPDSITVQELFDKFKDMPTPIGKAWLGKIKGIKGDCLIYGPGVDNSYIYTYAQGKKLYVCANECPTFIDDGANPIKGPKKEAGGLDYKDILC